MSALLKKPKRRTPEQLARAELKITIDSLHDSLYLRSETASIKAAALLVKYADLDGEAPGSGWTVKRAARDLMPRVMDRLIELRGGESDTARVLAAELIVKIARPENIAEKLPPLEFGNALEPEKGI